MKIYISGKIGDMLDPAERNMAIEKFNNAKELLNEIGNFESVTPFDNGMPTERNLGTFSLYRNMDNFDGIFLLNDWQSDESAYHEFVDANRKNKFVLYQSEVMQTSQTVMRIKTAIQEATGMRFEQYVTKSRKRDGFFARMLFVFHCRKHKMKLTEIAKYVHRDHSSMLHLLNKYEDEVKFNPYFRGLAERVQSILNKTTENK